MDDREMKILLGSLEEGNVPPEGLKESMLEEILEDSGEIADKSTSDKFGYKYEFNFLQRLFFVKPLRTASVLSASLSAILWALFRDNYVNLLSGIIGMGVR